MCEWGDDTEDGIFNATTLVFAIATCTACAGLIAYTKAKLMYGYIN